jgi:transposase
MHHVAQSSETTVDLHAQLSAAQQAIESKDHLIASKNHQLAKQKSYIDQLEEFIRNLRQKQFGASSEAQDTLQSGLFDEGEGEPADDSALAADTVTVAAHARQSRKLERIPAELPREEIVHDLAEADKVCPHDGSALRLIGADQSASPCAPQIRLPVLRAVRGHGAETEAAD